MLRTVFSLVCLRVREAEAFVSVCTSTTPLLHTDLKEFLRSGYVRASRISGALGLWIPLRVAELHPVDPRTPLILFALLRECELALLGFEGEWLRTSRK